MPLCSGNVAVPSGCSTALVMNCAPGHAPQLPPLPVDAPAGAARAATGTAAAASAVKPSAILENLVLSVLSDLTIVCPFCYRVLLDISGMIRSRPAWSRVDAEGAQHAAVFPEHEFEHCERVVEGENVGGGQLAQVLGDHRGGRLGRRCVEV